MNDELVLVLVLDQAGADELLHHVGRQSTGLGILLELLDLESESVDLMVPGELFSLSLDHPRLVSSDLCQGPSPLAGPLEQVGRDSFGH